MAEPIRFSPQNAESFRVVSDTQLPDNALTIDLPNGHAPKVDNLSKPFTLVPDGKVHNIYRIPARVEKARTRRAAQLAAIAAIVDDLPGFMSRKYENGLSVRQICEEINKLSESKIKPNPKDIEIYLRLIGVRFRSRSEAAKKSWQNNRDGRKAAKERLWNDPEKRNALLSKMHNPSREAKTSISLRTTHMRSALKTDDPRTALVELHHIHGLSVREIAGKIGCSMKTVELWMIEKGVEIRKEERVPKPQIKPENKQIVDFAFSSGLIKILTNREEEIILLRYGQNLTLEIAGKKMGITRAGASLLEQVALNKLRKATKTISPDTCDLGS